ncbi:MAG: septum formation initiator family protein [Blastocatellia bacterium]|nr:septum formation initiator family protein [Blastocatellia bacterium]
MNATAKKKTKERAIPRWAHYVAAISLAIMIALTINYRAFSELRTEDTQHEELQRQIQRLTDENLALQEEIHYLKTDPKMIEREVKKFGLKPREEQFSTQPNK